MTTSCYCWSWRSLHRRTNAGIVWVSAPGDYALFISNHIPDGTEAGVRKTLARISEAAGFEWLVRISCGMAVVTSSPTMGAIPALQHYLGHRNIQHPTRYTELATGPFEGWRD